MMPLPGSLVDIQPGLYRVGISTETGEALVPHLTGTPIKPEYIASAIPCHIESVSACSLGAWPVTMRQFKHFAEETGYVTEAEHEGWAWTWDRGWARRDGLSWRRPFGTIDDGICTDRSAIMPVVQVSWNDATAYCRWLALSTGRIVRLSREIEWEVFAGATDLRGLADISAGMNASPYGDLSANLMAALDEGMKYGAGLVWEWTEDWFTAYPGGMPHRDHGRVYRVLRGGSFMSHPIQRTREFRLRKCPTARSPFYGFRIAVGCQI